MESNREYAAFPRASTRRELETIWQRERRWIAAVLLAHMGPGDDLEDLLQEVALSFVQHVSELRDPGKLRPWLRTVAINAARGAARRGRRQRRHLRPLGQEAPEVADPRDERERAADEARSACEKVMQRISSLKPGYREPLLLRAVQGMSQRRIAEVLGMPETTVETRLARARRQLREALRIDREGLAPHGGI